MLTATLNSPRKLVALGSAIAVITAMTAPPAMAWGDKEQGFVAGVASTLLVATIANPTWYYKKPAPPVYQAPAPAPIYYTPPPVNTFNIYTTPSAVAFNSYQQSQQMQIQSGLAALGYYRGSIDGAFGPATYNAVVAYANGAGKPTLLSSTSGAYTIYDGLLY